MRLRTGSGLLAAFLAVTGALIAAPPGSAGIAVPSGQAGAAAADEALLLLNHEHVDAMAPIYEDGTLSLRAEVDLQAGNDQLLDPADLLFQLKDAGNGRLSIPDVPEYGFLGAPGDPVWLVPQSQDPDLVWAGWTTERLPHDTFVDDAVQLHLRDVQGPGHVEIFMEDSAGLPLRVLSSTDPTYRSYDQPVGWHSHADWAFSALGDYTLSFEVTATTLDGTAVSTGPVDYRWRVGYVASDVTLATTPAAPGFGDPVTLTARVGAEAVGEAGLPGTVNFLDGTAILGEAPVADGTATLTTSDLAVGAHALTARFVPDPDAAHVHDAHQPATSDVVDLTVGPTDPGLGPDPTDPECPIDVVLDVGHVDVATRLPDGELVSQVKDGTAGVAPAWRDLETVAFHVKPEGRTQVPPGGVFDFLGPSGSDVWQIPQTQDPNLLWAGWNTEEIDYDLLSGGVTWHLDTVEGPGEVAVYQTTGFGEPRVIFDSSDPLPQSIGLGIPTHAHGNWAFDAEGIYELTFRHTATLASGQPVSDSGTLAVAVGDVDLDDLCPGGNVPDPDPPTTSTTVPPPGSPTTTTSATSDDDRTPKPRQVTCTSSDRTSTPSGGDSSAAGAVVLDQGHVDYAARLVDGDLVSEIKDGTVAGTTTWRSPADVVMHLKAAAKATVPAGEQFSFLGPAGTPIWQIPQTQDPDLLWLGWNTEELTAAQVSGPVTWRLDAVDGPGELAVYELGSFGQPTVRFTSGDGAGDAFSVPLGTHAHGNWAFTAEGTYEVTFTHRATLASGRAVTDTETLRIVVGAADPAALAAAPASTSSSSSSSSTTAGSPSTTRSGADCRLARTGSDIGNVVVAGVLAIAGGAACLYAGRRRRRATRGAPT